MIKKILIHLAVLVAALAAIIGGIGKFYPALFMKVPNIGFILWAITGHPVPPYFSPDAWEPDEMRSWIRDGDVVVATGAKSGTTWMLYCAHEIRTKGSDEFNYTDTTFSTPWPDLIQTPGATWAQQKKEMHTAVIAEVGKPWKDFWDNAVYPFRVFKSHFTPLEAGGVIPVRQFPKVKFLAMTRYGLDVVASLVPFFDNHSEEFRKVWGGFPPASTGDSVTDAEQRLKDVLPGGILYHLYFTYVKQWWLLRNEPNVLFLHYSDALKNTKKTVRKLSEFYGVSLTEAELDKVTDRCSFSSMKKLSYMFDYGLPLNHQFDGKRIMKTGKQIRKGQNGDSKNIFTEEQTSRWTQAEEIEFKDQPELLNWARNGDGN
jgi:aryl sulfotransferase